LDYLETEPAVNAKRVGIAGVSRYGKAALVTMAFDERFAMGLIASSGAGGTKLNRRNFGESLENLASSGEYHWMAGNYIKYGAEESAFGRRTAEDMPVDSHMTLALCAPRLTFISHGIPEKGDANWLDHQGSFMAAIGAQPVFRLLGARDLGRSDDYKIEKMPAVNVDMLDGQLAWRQHDGGHTDEPNVEHFIKWTDRLFAKADGKEPPTAVAPTSLHKAIIGVCRQQAPEAAIVLTGVFPRSQNLSLKKTIDEINTQLSTLADGKRIRFLNINDRIADADGRLLEGMSSDGLHLEAQGYEVWAAALKPILTEILGPPATEDHAPPATGDPSAAKERGVPPGS
jgi:lysophospholipase L1-like esterase